MSTPRHRTRDRLALRHLLAPRKTTTRDRCRSQPPGSGSTRRRNAPRTLEVSRNAR